MSDTAYAFCYGAVEQGREMQLHMLVLPAPSDAMLKMSICQGDMMPHWMPHEAIMTLDTGGQVN